MKTPKIFIVTGTPGTGKTTFAKKLAREKQAVYLGVNALIKKEKLYQHYDRSLQTREVNIQKLNKRLIAIIKDHKRHKESLVIDSHLSHYLPNNYVDQCFVTRCSLRALRQRLKKRRYSKKKVQENMHAEIFEVCLLEAIANKQKKVKIIDTTKRK